MSKCPICKKAEAVEEYKPFCSKRCADVDLGNWLNEKYTVEAVDLDEQEVEELAGVISSELDN
ncbi:MAG: DNA gyrase inhibitor YacG [Lactobacillaceae bacterium]|jgi:endogenous inhibitor of DNA gyrase (YacG/DUF329 family)|nr:DNA gyrase inhibitor YacG [Lactobacillaceae bacterium]